jgi:hypothetical protein
MFMLGIVGAIILVLFLGLIAYAAYLTDGLHDD